MTTTFPQARGRFFFDVTFFIIVSTIGLNIVLGIIVDSYSELRDERVSFYKNGSIAGFGKN